MKYMNKYIVLAAFLLIGSAACVTAPQVLQRQDSARSADAKTQMLALQKQLAKQPRNLDVLNELAQLAAFFDQDNKRAWSMLRRSRALQPWSADSALLACDLSTQERQYADIERYCGDVIKRFSAQPQALQAMANLESIFGQTRDRDTAVLELMEQGLQSCQKNAAADCAHFALRLARVRLTLFGQAEKAAAYEQALQSVSAMRDWTLCRVSPPGIDFFRSARSDLSVFENLPPSACRPRHSKERQIYPAASSDMGVFVLRNAVYVGQTGLVTLYMRLPGAAQLRIDGLTLVSKDPWRRPGDGAQIVPLWMAKGWHNVQVLTQPQRQQDALSIWAVRRNGQAAFSQQQALMPAGQSTARIRLVDDGRVKEQQVEQWINKSPWKALQVQQRATDDFAPRGEYARGLALRLLARYPESGAAWFALAEGLRTDPTLGAAQRKTESRAALQKVLQYRPGHLLARYRLATSDFAERPKQALQMMRALVLDYPDYPWGLRRLHKMLLQRGLKIEAGQVLQKLLKLTADEQSLSMAAAYYRRVGDVQKARWAQQQSLALSADLSCYRRARWLLNEGQAAKALALYDAMFARAPDSAGYDAVLELARQVESWDGVAKRALARLRDFPSDRSTATWLVRAARAGADLIGPAEALDKAESVSPSDPQWTRARWRLGIVEPEVFPRVDAQAMIRDFASERLAHPEIYAGHPYSYVLDGAGLYWDPAGGLSEWTHQIIRVESKKGADSLGQQHLPIGAELFLLRVIKADGSIYEPQDPLNNGDISLSNLEVGDFIEKRYRVLRRPDRIDAAQRTQFYFAADVPIFLSQLILLGPPKKLAALQIKGHGNVPDQQHQENDGLVQLTYSATRVAAFVAEPFSASAMEYIPHLTVSQGYDPDLFVHRAMRAAASTEAMNQELINYAKALVASPSTTHGLLPSLVRSVAKQVPHDGPESRPVVILHSHQGQAIYLLRAVLKALAQPVRLIGLRAKKDISVDDWSNRLYQNTALLVRRSGVWTPVYFMRRSAIIGHLPARWRGGTWRVIDPSWPKQALGQSAQAIPENWIRTPPHLVKVDASLDAQGQLQGSLHMQIQDPLAGFLRTYIPRMDRRDVKRIFEAWLGNVFAGARVQKIDMQGLDDILQPMIVDLKFSSDHYATARADALVVDRLLPTLSLIFGKDAAGLRQFTSLATRKSPMYLNAYDERAVFRLQFPKAYKVLSPPPELSLDGAFGRYHQHVRSSPQALEIERDVHRPRGLVKVENYSDLRRAAQQIDKALGGQFVLVPEK